MNLRHDKIVDFIIIFAVISAAYFAAFVKITGYDFWWVLADGRYVVENLEIPKIDVFRFVSIDREFPWTNHLYLTGSIFYILYLMGGFGALSIFKASISSAIFTCLYFILRLLGKDRIIQLVLVMLAIFAVRFRLLMRADMYTFLFFVLMFYILARYRKGLSSPLYMMPLIMLAWVNLHAGYIAGVVLMLTVLGSELIKIILAGKFKIHFGEKITVEMLRRLSIYSTVSLLAVLVNPYGKKAYAILNHLIFKHSGASGLGKSVATARVGEWQPLALFHFKGIGICFTSEYGFILILALVSALIALKKLDLTDLLLSIGFIYATTISIRFIPVAVFVTVPFIYKNYRAFMDNDAGINMKRGVTCLILLVALVGNGVGIAGLYEPPKMSPGMGVKEDKFPEGAVDFIKRNGIDGNMFNSYGIGGYLIWSFYPERRVFMDGRVLSNIGDYYEMIDSSEGWEKGSSRYNFDVIFLDNDQKDFPFHLFSNPQWKLVYWDDNGIVLLKDIPKYRDIINKNSYVYTIPSFYDFSYMDHYLKSRDKVLAVEAELVRNINSSKQNSEARLALAFLYINSGKNYYDAAFKEIKKAIQVSPDIAMAHSALGWLYLQRGMKDEGMKELNKALSLNPYENSALRALSQLKKKQK